MKAMSIAGLCVALAGSPVLVAAAPEGHRAFPAQAPGNGTRALRLPDGEALHRQALEQGALSENQTAGNEAHPAFVSAAVLVGVVLLVVLTKKGFDNATIGKGTWPVIIGP